MMRQVYHVGLLLNLVLAVSAQSTSTTEICTTSFGASSVDSVPTVTTTTVSNSITVTEKAIITPNTTVTVATPTVTSTFTAYNTKSVTVGANSITVTSTITDTITAPPSTTTVTVEDDETTTITSYTSTVPTPDGFTPISSESNAPGKVKPRHAKNLVARSDPTVVASLQGGSVVTSPTQYPTAVNCRVEVKITSTSYSTTTAKKTITSKVTPPASTTTKTVLTKTTVTVDADSTVLTTSTTQVPASENITSTSTSTNTAATVVVPTGYYAACSDSNIAHGEYFNEPIFSTTTQPEGTFNGITGNNMTLTPYECCVTCQQAAGCIWFEWDEIYCDPEFNEPGLPPCNPSINAGCSFLTMSGCPNYGGDTFNTYDGPLTNPNSFVLGNGPCGQWTFTGDTGYT